MWNATCVCKRIFRRTQNFHIRVMKKTYIMILAGLAVTVAAVTPLCFSQNTPAPAAPEPAAATPAASPEQAKKAFSYFMGYRFGQEVASGAATLTAADFDPTVFFQGLDQALKGEQPTMSQAEIEAGMNTFVETLRTREAAQAKLNLEKGKAFEAEFAKKEGVTKTESGLLYRIVTPAEGRKYDEAKDGKDAVCLVTYEGKKIDGKVFDATTTPIEMPINQVVPGFAEALKLMPIGSTCEVCIPAALAYGEQAPGPIGSNSTLVFTISLKDIKKNEPAQGGMPFQLTPEMLQQLQQQGLQNGAPAPADETPAPAAE